MLVGVEVSRRQVVTGLAAVPIAVLTAGAPVLAEARRRRTEPLRRVRARSGASLVDAVGVGVHLGFLDTPYVRTDRVLAALQDLGVRHVRDELRTDQPQQWVALRRLGAAGIRSDLIVGPRPDQAASFASHDPAEHVAVLARELAGTVAAVEGLNEWDLWGGDDWAEQVRAWQRGLAAAVRRTSALAGVPVLAPSITWPRNWAEAGDFAGDADRENAHVYPDGQEPGAILRRRLAAFRAAHPDRPLVVTETGYHNAVGPPDDETIGHPPVPEHVAATYLPRLVAGNLALGVQRTYLHELLDQFADPARVKREDNFGLLRHDLTPKPAYVALRDLLRLAGTGPTGAARAPGSLTHAVDGAPDDLRRLLLQRADGTFVLLLWRDVSVWDVRTRTPRSVDPARITVRLARPAAWRVQRPGTTGSRTGRGRELHLDLAARLTAVVITPR